MASPYFQGLPSDFNFGLANCCDRQNAPAEAGIRRLHRWRRSRLLFHRGEVRPRPRHAKRCGQGCHVLQKACDGGNAKGCSALALMYDDGKGIFRPNLAQINFPLACAYSTPARQPSIDRSGHHGFTSVTGFNPLPASLPEELYETKIFYDCNSVSIRFRHTVEFSPAFPYHGAFFFLTYQHGSC